MTRFMLSGEETLTAAEIAERIEAQLGREFSATKVGNAAKSLDLDYEEVDYDVPTQPGLTVKQRRYSVVDIPEITRLLIEKYPK